MRRNAAKCGAFLAHFGSFRANLARLEYTYNTPYIRRIYAVYGEFHIRHVYAVYPGHIYFWGRHFWVLFLGPGCVGAAGGKMSKTAVFEPFRPFFEV